MKLSIKFNHQTIDCSGKKSFGNVARLLKKVYGRSCLNVVVCSLTVVLPKMVEEFLGIFPNFQNNLGNNNK